MEEENRDRVPRPGQDVGRHHLLRRPSAASKRHGCKFAAAKVPDGVGQAAAT